MPRPQYVNLTCPHCGQGWLQPTDKLLAAKLVIYRDIAHGDEQTDKRRVTCPNCGKAVLADVPKEWLANE